MSGYAVLDYLERGTRDGGLRTVYTSEGTLLASFEEAKATATARTGCIVAIVEDAVVVATYLPGDDCVGWAPDQLGAIARVLGLKPPTDSDEIADVANRLGLQLPLAFGTLAMRGSDEGDHVDRESADEAAAEADLDLNAIEEQASRAGLDETWRQEAASPDEVRALVGRTRDLERRLAGIQQLCDDAELARLLSAGDDPDDLDHVAVVTVADLRRAIHG